MRPEFYADYFRVEGRHWWFVGRRHILLERLRANPPPAGTDRTPRILDVGCGTGTMLAYLRDWGEVAGVDADAEAVRFSHLRGEEGVSQLHGYTLPFGDGSLDLVTVLDVLEHVEDDGRMLREIARVLRPGGRLLATVPAYRWMWGPQDEVSNHFRRYTAGRLVREVEGAGLRIDHTTYFNTLLFAPIAAIRLLRRLRRRPATAGSDFELTRIDGAGNRLLAAVFSAEARWLKSRRLPFGVSVLVEASVPASEVEL